MKKDVSELLLHLPFIIPGSTLKDNDWHDLLCQETQAIICEKSSHNNCRINAN